MQLHAADTAVAARKSAEMIMYRHGRPRVGDMPRPMGTTCRPSEFVLVAEVAQESPAYRLGIHRPYTHVKAHDCHYYHRLTHHDVRSRVMATITAAI